MMLSADVTFRLGASRLISPSTCPLSGASPEKAIHTNVLLGRYFVHVLFLLGGAWWWGIKVPKPAKVPPARGVHRVSRPGQKQRVRMVFRGRRREAPKIDARTGLSVRTRPTHASTFLQWI